MAKQLNSDWFSDLYGRMVVWARDLSHRSMAICLSVGLLACFILVLRPPFIYPVLTEQELKLEDEFFAWRQSVEELLNRHTRRPSDVVIVSIDDESAKRLAGYPPWPRQFYARLLEKLRDAGARAIGFTVMFPNASPLAETPFRKPWLPLPGELSDTFKDSPEADDAAFAEQLKKTPNVVLPTTVEVSTDLFAGRTRYSYRMPYEPFVMALSSTDCLGNMVIEPDSDGVVRRSNLVFPNFQSLSSFYNSFALRVVERAYGDRASVLGSKLFLGERTYPTTLRINFAGPTGTVEVVPFWKALDWERHYQNLAGENSSDAYNPFKGKIVLVGFHNISNSENEFRPGFEAPSRALSFYEFPVPNSGSNQPMSAVELQANVISNLEQSNFLNQAEWWEGCLLIMFVSLLFARLFGDLQGRPWTMLGWVVLFSFAWLLICFTAFYNANCVIPSVVPIFGVAFPAWFLVLADQNLYLSRDRRKHTRVFQKHVGKTLASEIQRRTLVDLGLQGKRAVVTVLLCQAHGVSSIISKQQPERALEMFNDYVNTMITSVQGHNGIVDRVWGHALTAFWGAPIAMQEKSQARLAANCMVEIKERIDQLKQRWSTQFGVDANELLVRFGINTGDAVCGSIGYGDRTEYGAIGETADLTLCFEALNRRYGTSCVIGAGTAGLLSEQFEVRELDKVRLEGHQDSIYIYELVGKKGKLPGAVEEAVNLYRQGRAAMQDRDFEAAERLFQSILRLLPDDRPTLIMVERCKEYANKPPEANWDGAVLVALD